MGKAKISRLELVEKLSEKVEITRSKANQVIDALKEIVIEAAKEDKKILVRNFFKVEPYISKQRKVKVPNKDKVITVKPKKKIKISISDSIIEEINKTAKKRKGKK